jgi:hypothetical protein
MQELVKSALQTFLALIAGAIDSLVAPWANWRIEKRRQRLAARKEFIAMARRAVEAGQDKAAFRETAIYSQLRSLLSERTRREIESDTISIQITGGRGSGGKPYYVKHVLDELQALERKWKLL